MLQQGGVGRGILFRKFLRKTDHRTAKRFLVFPKVDLSWTNADDRWRLNSIKLEVVKVFSFSLKEEQFKVVVAMNSKPGWSLSNGFLESSDKNFASGRHPTGIVGERINRNFAPH